MGLMVMGFTPKICILLNILLHMVNILNMFSILHILNTVFNIQHSNMAKYMAINIWEGNIQEFLKIIIKEVPIMRKIGIMRRNMNNNNMNRM